jgi:uncharacterized protein (DUF2141 family)
MRSIGILLITCLFFSFSQENTRLDIEISNIRSHKGIIRISVYTAPDQYPYHPAKTYEVKKDSVVNGVLHTSIRNLAPGEYGLCFLDDENNSGQLDSNFIGIPQEGFGFANNPKPLLKRPDYQHVTFKLTSGINHIHLITRYKN